MPTDHSEAALDILNQTNDGDDLSKPDLQLLMLAVNGGLSPAGDTAFLDLASRVASTYTRPWFRGVEHITIDTKGFVYWKGIEVEHYCTHLMTAVEQQTRTDELARRCRIVEGRGLTVTGTNVIWDWVEPLAPEAPCPSTTPITSATASPTA
jgi:hypothetical protein